MCSITLRPSYADGWFGAVLHLGPATLGARWFGAVLHFGSVPWGRDGLVQYCTTLKLQYYTWNCNITLNQWCKITPIVLDVYTQAQVPFGFRYLLQNCTFKLISVVQASKTPTLVKLKILHSSFAGLATFPPALCGIRLSSRNERVDCLFFVFYHWNLSGNNR